LNELNSKRAQMKAKICVSIAEPTAEGAIAAAEAADADIIEIRLDCLKSVKGIEKIAGIGKPVMATCMPKWEGGMFAGKEGDRAAILTDSLKYADYVSLELRTEKELRNRIINENRKNKKNTAKVIISYHDHEKTPEKQEIKRIIREEHDAGADIAKVAFFASDVRDVLRVMDALAENETGIPVIAISMGEKGKVSRIMAQTTSARSWPSWKKNEDTQSRPRKRRTLRRA
jgi:3-dehydroquinate dehydratase-1